MNEEAIIQDVQAGDTEQYRQLVERYQTGLILYLENIVRSRDDAEDIAQDSFIKAYRNIQKYDNTKAKFSTWLYRIAANGAVDMLRRRKQECHVDDIEQSVDTATERPLYDDEIEVIRQAIDALEPPKFARLIRAYYWEGKTYQQIAKEMGVTTNTVGTWLHRAKHQLREELA